MEFGHNDQKQKGPGKGAYYSFMTSLKTFIDEARAERIRCLSLLPSVVVSTPTDISATHEDYPEAMRWLAAKENVPLIDLNEMTRTLYEALGPDTSNVLSSTIRQEHIRDRPGILQIIRTLILTVPIRSPNASSKG